MEKLKERIMKMSRVHQLCHCPNCKNIVQPRFSLHGGRKSGLYWCPVCLDAQAGMFWRVIIIVEANNA